MLLLKNVSRTYWMGETRVDALRNLSLEIKAGEFVAIMGPSGSGKSTLMHLLGLLDVPDTGSYNLCGSEVQNLSDAEISALRGQSIGFVFQQFHLLARLSALQNIELPVLYRKGQCPQGRAMVLLRKVGLEGREHHRPSQLSGGQQQRVAIARALMNDPLLILADEPTGNLDSRSSREIMALLQELNNSGITVILVTHEEDIAAYAGRIVRLRDGELQLDERKREGAVSAQPAVAGLPQKRSNLGHVAQHFLQGWRSVLANKVRAALSMLGILIGVASVVAMLALGRGAQQAIEEQMKGLGTNLLMLRSGAVRMGGVMLETGAATRLNPEDAEAIRDEVPGINAVCPAVNGRAQVSAEGKNWSTQVSGVLPAYAVVRSAEPAQGRFFTEAENRSRRRLALIGMTVKRNIFGDQPVIGKSIKVNRINFQIIGELPERGMAGPRDQDDLVVIPLQTAMRRLLGRNYIDQVDIQVADEGSMESVSEGVKELLFRRHRIPPLKRQDAFELRNMADIQKAFAATSKTTTTLLAIIAAISLLVGGIGIMNIMLVSVTERTREIGLRKAIGARRADILLQFLAESVVVTLIGGLLGILLGWGITLAMSTLAGWNTVLSPDAVALAFIFSVVTGLVFGLYPARKASWLNPIDALRYE